MQDAASSLPSGRALNEQVPQIAGSAQSTSAPRHPMVVKAAREMARIHAEACNVNRDDLWMVEGESFIDEADSVLYACGGVELLEALREVAQSLAWLSFGECRGFSDGLLTSNEALARARAAIAKATGEQA